MNSNSVSISNASVSLISNKHGGAFDVNEIVLWRFFFQIQWTILMVLNLKKRISRKNYSISNFSNKFPFSLLYFFVKHRKTCFWFMFLGKSISKVFLRWPIDQYFHIKIGFYIDCIEIFFDIILIRLHQSRKISLCLLIGLQVN